MDPLEQKDHSNCIEMTNNGVDCVEYRPASQYPEDYDLPDENGDCPDIDCQSSADDPTQLLMKLEARFDHEHSQTKRGFHWLAGQVQQLVNQQATNSYQEVETHIQEFQAIIKEKDYHFQLLNADYERLVSAHQSALEEIRRLEDESAMQFKGNGQSLANSSKVSDAEIRGLWKQMRYNIRALVSELTDEPPGETLCPKAHEMMSFVQKDYWQILQDETLRDELLQAYIWAFLLHDVWIGRQVIRKGYLVASLKVLQSRLSVTSMSKEDHRQSQSWLASGFAHFTTVEPIDESALQALISKRFDWICPFMPALDVPTRSRIYHQLYDIYKDAVDIDMMLVTSKARVDLRRIAPGKPANKYTMDSEQGMKSSSGSNSRVLFMISPLHRKWGNANGDDMDKSMILAKATVVLCPEAPGT